ncbi:MAG: DUF1579 family protein [Planctomycetota bacterium]
MKKSLLSVIILAGVALAIGRAAMPSEHARAATQQETPAGADMTDALRAMMEMATPGRHHHVLDRLIGSWTGEFTVRSTPEATPMVFTGVVDRRWVLEGRFIEERVEAEGPMGTLKGIGYIGYNNFDQQYESVWMETGSTAMSFEKGTLHGDRMLLHLRREHRDPASGRVVYSWGKLDMSDPNRHTYVANETSPDGTTFRAREGVLVRKAGG